MPERVLAQAQAPERAQEPVLAPELAREPELALGPELAQEPVCWPLALRRVPDARRFCRKRNTRQSPG
ncbi:hypothetical protein A9K72_07655 [Mesorhizobium loti]|nr:hypothetical protein A9K72_07655 [Mesorhizobium loti]BCG99104.1 hypothetical protein MesoLj131b_11040 [Mesorhizobium sp. 131-2-5]